MDQHSQTTRRHGFNPVLLFFGLAGLYLALALYLGVVTPFAAIASNSMHPFLSRGDLVFVKAVAPSAIATGDVVVISVPKAYQKQYSYPSTVIHRVTGVLVESGGLRFQTKGDNTNPDPFQATPEQVKGRYLAKVPGVGFVLLYFRSLPGLLFVAFAFVVILGYLYGGDALAQTRRMVLGPAAVTPAGTTGAPESPDVQQSLEHFAMAMQEYAHHLQTHTSVLLHLDRTTDRLEMVVERLLDRMESLDDGALPTANATLTPELQRRGRASLTTAVLLREDMEGPRSGGASDEDLAPWISGIIQ